MQQLQTVAIAITLDTGELAVMRFLTRGRGNRLPVGAQWIADGWWDRDASAANVEHEVRKTFEGHSEQPTTWRVVPDQAIPTDRTYRAAWADIGGVIAHDIAKARGLHRDRLRAARTVKLAALDVEYQRADEKNDPQEKQRIADKKQTLRDLPAHPDIEAAQTIAQLKAFWPADLD